VEPEVEPEAELEADRSGWVGEAEVGVQVEAEVERRSQVRLVM